MELEYLVRLKPNAKGELVLDRQEMRTKFVYYARLGKHVVKLTDGPVDYPDEVSALAAAVEIRRQMREAIKNKQA